MADDLLHLALPVLHAANQHGQVLLVEVTWLDPIDLHTLFDLINVTTHQFQRHGLHDHQLDIRGGEQANLGDILKRYVAVVFTQLENVLQESDDADFLTEVSELFHDVGEALQHLIVALNCLLELYDLSTAQGLQQIEKPFEVRHSQTPEDFFVQELCNVENLFSEQDRHS